MNVKELIQKLTDLQQPEAEVVIDHDPAVGWFGVDDVELAREKSGEDEVTLVSLVSSNGA